LAAFVLALRDTPIQEPLLYVCNNHLLLKAVNGWIGEGGKATLVGALDADILAGTIEILRKRITAGTAAFLVKVKAHGGEPANEGADILADKAISDPKVGKESPGANGRIEQSSRGKNRAARQGKNLIKIVIRHLIMA